ncbi:MAG TPA: winged helix-turn-helix domain-containing protein [Phenylobacterium sp.]
MNADIRPTGLDLAREPTFRLGEADVHPSTREVVAGERRELLEPRVMQVLVALARKRGDVVSREELVQSCWSGRIVGDDAINRCIGQLRRLARGFGGFGVDTVARVGYRLTAAQTDPAPPFSSKPSIAVMPFANLSDDPEQAYFTDGMVEEIVGALSRFRSIFVISMSPSGGLAETGASPREAARELGVSYLLEGSVRRAVDRVRITINLIDAHDGARIWSDRLEDTLEDVFALQDRVALRVACAVDTSIWGPDVERASPRMTNNTSAYDLYLRAHPLFLTFQKPEILQTIDLLDRAIALDPDFAMALSQNGVCHRLVLDNGWTDDPDAFRQRGLTLAERALKVGGDNPRVLSQVAASLPGLEGRLDRALVLIDRAIQADPASAFIWLISGTLRLRNGEAELAAQHLETAMRLDPISRMAGVLRMYLATARVQQGRFEDALALYQTTASRLAASHAILAAVCGHLGQPVLAREALSQFALAHGAIEDVARVWFRRPEHRKLFLDGIALSQG